LQTLLHGGVAHDAYSGREGIMAPNRRRSTMVLP
jgi:hypothetical protein